MTLTELRYIVMLAKEQHFGKAAKGCFVSQPTLSIAVKKLEGELGVALFERTKRRVRPTPIGEQIIAQARRILEQAADIKRLATAGQNQLGGPLRVGAIFTIGPYLFPHLIPRLQRLTNSMPLVIEESYTATLRTRLRDGELDAVILSLPFTEAGVLTTPLYQEPFVTLLPTTHPLARRKLIKPTDIQAENLLMLGEGHCFRDQILEQCPPLRAALKDSRSPILTATEGSSLETLRHMVASGLGITILPCSATRPTHYGEQELVIRRFQPPAPARTVALAWRASFPRHRAIEALRQGIEQCDLNF
ncbi:MAG: hydrogen peroxide-inducible genes activator [Cellvibrionales bacterium]|nr:hydrogen peroxide-inducible genes activator [Cellvibrionales bacterium]